MSRDQIGRADGQRATRGFIVVASLWMLVALAALASVASVHVARSAVSLSINEEPLRTDAAITAGLELTAYHISAGSTDLRPTRGAFRFRLGDADISVEYRSEAARVHLNAASKEVVAGLFRALGAPADAADQYADRVIAWRTPPKRNAPDEHDALYRAAGLPYGPRRAAFAHVDELWLVAGLPPALVERALGFVTIYGSTGEINVIDAPPEVIAALPGMSSARLDAFLNQRDTSPADPSFIAGVLGPQVGMTTQGSDAYRVRMRIRFADGRVTTPEIVIASGSSGPYAVLSWQDEIDLASGRPRTPAERR